MSTANVLLVCFSLLLISKVNLTDLGLNKNSNSYGPYDLQWTRYETCSGPKATNLTNVTAEVINNEGVFSSWVNFTFFTQAHIDEVKIIVYTIKDKQNNLLWSYRLNDPCRHYAIASIIDKNLNANHCVVKKGFYSCFLNLVEVTHSFFGTSFFYGDYLLKSIVLSKKGNIMCLLVNLKVLKKGNV